MKNMNENIVMENSFYSVKEWCENCEYNRETADYTNNVCMSCITNLIKNSNSIISEQPQHFLEKEDEKEDEMPEDL